MIEQTETEQTETETETKPTAAKLNRYARWVYENGDFGPWTPYGNVTHEEAAKRHASFYERGGLIQTTEDHGETVYEIKVTRRIVYDAVCYRGDKPE